MLEAWFRISFIASDHGGTLPSYLIVRGFLGLAEFAPGNVLYHEGRKHRVDAAVLPPAGIEDRLRRARLCKVCGYAHDDESVTVDLCEHCGTQP